MPQVLSRYVEVCVFKLESGQPQFLLLRRDPTETLHPGIWQIVTGTIEKNETTIGAARREVLEETGLVPVAFWVIPRIDAFYSHQEDAIDLCPMFAARVEAGGDLKLSSEHCEYGWFSVEEAVEKVAWPAQHEAMRIVHESIISGGEFVRLKRIL